MANLIIIAGPQAVGKMTVAEELRDRIGYSLMVNHDSIEVSDKIFGMKTPAQRELNQSIRKSVFDIAIKYDVNMILTLVVAFELPEEIEYLNNLKSVFEKSGGKFFFVELEAELETRLERNVTPHRLESKKSKNDIEWSKNDLLKTMQKHKLNTDEGEVLFPNHLKINNTNLSPTEVVDIVLEKFNLLRDKKVDENETL